MKTNFSTEATVKRSISIKPIGDSDFVCYEDTFITTIVNFAEKGVLSPQ